MKTAQKSGLFGIVILLLFASCKKDLAKHFEGDYIGTATKITFNLNDTTTYNNCMIHITTSGRNNILLDITASPTYHLQLNETVSDGGEFGHPYIGNRYGSGTSGKLEGLQLSFDYSFADPGTQFNFTFTGQKL